MTDPVVFRYRAFLSYSHRDLAVGDRLHANLESYFIPRDMVGKPGAYGPVPDKLRPIFRDRYDLEAGHSLKEQVEEALKQSEALIVVCSPHSAKSRYVNEEIRIFKALGRADRIYPIIIAGEPGSAEFECFPQNLRLKVASDGTILTESEEPIAADMREVGDGEELAKLKVVAGLIGVDLDGLRRREEEEQRRQKRFWRRIAWGMAALAVFATASSGLAWFEFQQKQFALTRNQQLLDKTLTRASNLVGIGTNVDQYGAPVKLGLALLDEAKGVFKDMDEIKVTSVELPIRRAEMLISFADSYAKVGRHVDQLQVANEARELLERATVEKPEDLSRWHLLASAWQRMGNGYSGQRALKEAIDAFEKAIEIRSSKLGGADSTQAEHLAGLSQAYQALSIAHNRRADQPKAKEVLQKSLQVADRLAAINADPLIVAERRVLTLIPMADIERFSGNRRVALGIVEQALDITETVRKSQPSDVAWLRREASLLLVRGDVQRDLRDFKQALESYSKCHEIRNRLHLADPGHASIAAELAYASIKVGEVEARQGNLDAAEKAFQIAADTYETQIKANPDNFSAARQMMDALDGLGDLAERRGRFEAMSNIYKHKVEVAERILAKDPENLDSQRLLAGARLSLGEAHASLGRHKEAVAEFRESVALRRKVLQATNKLFDLRNLAQVVESLGESLVALESLTEATALFGEAIGIREIFASAPEADDRSKVLLAGARERLAEVHLKRNEASAAVALLGPAVEARRAYAKSFSNEVTQRELAAAMERLAHASLEANDVKLSLSSVADALVIRRAQLAADVNSSQKKRNLAAALHLSGSAKGKANDCGPALEDLHQSRDLYTSAMVASPSNSDWPVQREAVLVRLASVASACGVPVGEGAPRAAAEPARASDAAVPAKGE